MLDGFKVPYGLGPDNRLIAPADAEKAAHYACPSCNSSLVFRRGGRVRAHFAHKATATCTGETVLHKIAKLLVRDALLEAARGSRSPTLEYECPHCRLSSVTQIPTRRAGIVEVEAPLTQGRIIDVLLKENGVPTFAVEILATHAVDEQKALDLDIPWVELRAIDVVKEPMRWKAVQAKLKCDRCKRCRIETAVTSEIVARICRRWSIQISAPYTAKPARCWKCDTALLYLSWGDESNQPSNSPEPRPNVLQWRYSRTVRHHYWGSTCPSCHALQGDFYEFDATSTFYYDVIAPEVDRRMTEAASSPPADMDTSIAHG